jgi:antitoxin (DNA-binding transcriptional repressor) of toxin-antitoxin stability system
MTIDDYLMTMREEKYTRVQVAQLKARLSEHLRVVRSGRTVMVLNRDLPVALLTPPPGTGPSLTLRRPDPDSPVLSKMTLPPVLDPPLDQDIVDLLLQERADR